MFSYLVTYFRREKQEEDKIVGDTKERADHANRKALIFSLKTFFLCNRWVTGLLGPYKNCATVGLRFRCYANAPESHGFVAVPVTSSNNFVSLH